MLQQISNNIEITSRFFFKLKLTSFGSHLELTWRQILCPSTNMIKAQYGLRSTIWALYSLLLACSFHSSYFVFLFIIWHVPCTWCHILESVADLLLGLHDVSHFSISRPFLCGRTLLSHLKPYSSAHRPQITAPLRLVQGTMLDQ